jgi:hypothetical protein
MGVEHLVGKRTGRRPGSKSMPPWKRDALWVYQNLDNPDAVPPSPFARALLTMAREDADRLLACLIMVSALEQNSAMPNRGPSDAQAVEPVATPLDDGKPRNLQRLHILERLLFSILRGEQRRWYFKIPDDARLVACERQGNAVEVLIRSEMFPVVPEGEPIPSVEDFFDRGL